MLIFGHPLIPSPTLYHIEDTEALVHTPPNGIVLTAFDEKHMDLVNYLRENDIRFALDVASIRELVLGENLGCTYLLVDKTLAKSAQKVAETYLFDAKILCRIDNESEIEPMAFEGIDGVICPEGIVKVSG